MILAIAANNEQKKAIEQKAFKENVVYLWVSSSAALYNLDEPDVFIDCLFAGDDIPVTAKPLLIHSPILTLFNVKASQKTARICAWNSLLERDIWEMALPPLGETGWVQTLMHQIGWNYQLVSDQPGLITPRVISMIINEAYFALGENISTMEEINTAMKLGTNYPFGPFEWADLIGIKNIRELLLKLSESDMRYLPADCMPIA